MENLTHGSLFSGIGGFDLAGESNGFTSLFNVEIEDFPRQVLAKHFPHSQQFKDIRDFDGTQFKDKVTVLSGGFPCQDLSIANSKAAGIVGERSGLWREYARILGEIRPRFVLFENSPMLIIRGLERVLCDFYRSGYDVEWRCFYATQWGYPHGRKRLYGLAYPSGFGRSSITPKGGILSKVVPTRKHREVGLPYTFKRFNANSDFSNVRIDNGFSQRLDRRRLKACGNSIVVDIASDIFKAIKEVVCK